MNSHELYATAESVLYPRFQVDRRLALDTITEIPETAKFGGFLVAGVIWRESDRAFRKEITAKVDSVMGSDWLPMRTPRMRFCLFVEVLRWMSEKKAGRDPFANRRRSPKGGAVVNGRRYRPGAYLPIPAPSFT